MSVTKFGQKKNVLPAQKHIYVKINLDLSKLRRSVVAVTVMKTCIQHAVDIIGF